MFELKTTLKDIKTDANNRYDSFKIEDISEIDITKIQDEAYIRNSTWLGGDQKFVCLAFDLDDSSKLSAKKHSKVMAKIYEYSTQSVYDILMQKDIKADYIDIKGDGVFAIYSGEKAIEKAFVAGITIKTFFKEVSSKFKANSINLKCKLSLDIDKILVKRIGSNKYQNEVWAGHLINNCYKMMGYVKEIREMNDTDINGNKLYYNKNIFVISEDIYNYLDTGKYKKFAILSCCENELNLWINKATAEIEEIKGDTVYFTISDWCDKCGETYANNILGLLV